MIANNPGEFENIFWDIREPVPENHLEFELKDREKTFQARSMAKDIFDLLMGDNNLYKSFAKAYWNGDEDFSKFLTQFSR